MEGDKCEETAETEDEEAQVQEADAEDEEFEEEVGSELKLCPPVYQKPLISGEREMKAWLLEDSEGGGGLRGLVLLRCGASYCEASWRRREQERLVSYLADCRSIISYRF